MNVQLNIEVVGERQFRKIEYLDRIRINGIAEMILECNSKGRRRNGKSREQWMDGLRKKSTNTLQKNI